MSDQVFLKQYHQLPDALKQELLEFLKFLVFKYQSGTEQNPPGKKTSEIKTSPKAGFLKGTFVMSPDFAEPLEDFKEYMA